MRFELPLFPHTRPKKKRFAKKELPNLKLGCVDWDQLADPDLAKKFVEAVEHDPDCQSRMAKFTTIYEQHLTPDQEMVTTLLDELYRLVYYWGDS